MFFWLCGKDNVNRLCLHFVPKVVISLVIPMSRRRAMSGSDSLKSCNERYNVTDVPRDAHNCKAQICKALWTKGSICTVHKWDAK